jgi:hypothetical protein
MKIQRITETQSIDLSRSDEVKHEINLIVDSRGKDGKHLVVRRKLDKMRELLTKYKKLAGYPIASIMEAVGSLELRQMYIEGMEECFNRQSFFLNYSALTDRTYSVESIKQSFRLKLQQVNTALFGVNWKTKGLQLSGFFALEIHNKSGGVICPHIHSVIQLPTAWASRFRLRPDDADYLFRHGVRCIDSLIDKPSLVQKEPKRILNRFGNEIFSDVKIEPVDLSRSEKLGNYLTKHAFRDDVVKNASEESAGLFKFHGDVITRIS